MGASYRCCWRWLKTHSTRKQSRPKTCSSSIWRKTTAKTGINGRPKPLSGSKIIRTEGGKTRLEHSPLFESSRIKHQEGAIRKHWGLNLDFSLSVEGSSG